MQTNQTRVVLGQKTMSMLSSFKVVEGAPEAAGSDDHRSCCKSECESSSEAAVEADAIPSATLEDCQRRLENAISISDS
jgi:hypothetical protein